MTWRTRWRDGVVALAVVATAAACSAPADEPAGLSTSAPPADVDGSSPPPSPTSDPSRPASTEPASDAPEPDPSFTQPFVPGEPSVIDLPEKLPIDVPDGASDAERAVIEATGRFMASWDAVLFGAGEQRSGIHETATGEQLRRLIDLGVNSAMQNKVTVGEPTVIDLVDVSVDADTAEVDICITMNDWVEYSAGEAEELDETERQLVTMVRTDGSWLASDTKPRDASSCG